MTLAPRPLALALLLLALCAGNAFAQAARPPAPTVSISTTPAGVRFVAPGAVAARLEVYDSAGASVFDSKFSVGNVSDWRARAGGFADGAYTCVLTVRDLAGRFHIKQATVLLRGGETSLALGEAEAAGETVPGTAPLEAGADAGAATLPTHDGRDGAVTSTAGALTLRTGDVLRGEEREHMRVTPEGRVGIGTSEPEATLDVAGAVRASGGFRFPDGTTLSAQGGRLRLTNEQGEVLPGPSAAAGTGTVNRLAKWQETGGAGTLTDAAGAEVSGLTFFGQNHSGQVAPLFSGAESFHVLEVGAPGTKSPLTLAGGSGVMEFWKDLGGGVGNPAAAIAFGMAKPGTGATSDMVFSTYTPGVNWNERMRLTTGGNLGVGMTTPTAKLHVANSQPTAAASGPGTNASPVLNVVGAKGGNALSQGPLAGTGSDVTVQAGAGGDQISGSTGVSGGNILLQAGAGGNNPGQHGGPGGSITLQPGPGGDGTANGGPAFDGPPGKLLLAPTGGRVGVGTATPEATLHVVGAGGLNDVFTAALLDAPPVLKVVGGKGGTDTNAGRGADVIIQAGAGGTTSGGGANGLGGSITLQPGASGGTPVFYSDVLLAPAGGKVGIGTDFPFADFDVRGNSRFEGTTTFDGPISAESLSSSQLQVSNWDTLEVDGPKGVVGLGTDDPEARLHLHGTAVFGLGTVSTSGLSVSGTGTDFNNKLSPGDFITASGQTRTVNTVNTNTSLTVTQAFSPNVSNQTFTFRKPLLRIGDGTLGILQSIVTPDGLFGIGTTTPANILHVSGPGAADGGFGTVPEVVAHFEQPSNTQEAAISVDSASGRDSIFYFAENGSAVWGLRNDADASDKFQLRYHGSGIGGDSVARLTVQTDGNVGIGTTTPARKLHISDAMRLQPIASPPASPASGDLYFDTSEALCVYVGGAWAKLAGPGTCN